MGKKLGVIYGAGSGVLATCAAGGLTEYGANFLLVKQKLLEKYTEITPTVLNEVRNKSQDLLSQYGNDNILFISIMFGALSGAFALGAYSSIKNAKD